VLAEISAKSPVSKFTKLAQLRFLPQDGSDSGVSLSINGPCFDLLGAVPLVIICSIGGFCIFVFLTRNQWTTTINYLCGQTFETDELNGGSGL